MKKTDLSLHYFFLLFVFLLLFIFPATRKVGVDRDSESYASNINTAIEENFSNSITGAREPTFFLIVYIANLLFSDAVRGTFVIYAFIAVFLKLKGINRYSDNFILSLILYISFFYILQEFNTIRSGIATGIFLVSYDDIKRKKLSRFLIKILIATLFHYSSIVLLIFYFVNVPCIKKNLNKIVILSIVFDVFNLNILVLKAIASVAPAFIGVKLNIYINMLTSGLFISVSKQRLIFNVCFLFIIFLVENLKIKKDTDLQTVLDIFKISVSFFFATKCVPVIASRISETSSIFLVLLIPLIVKHFKRNEQNTITLIITLICVPVFLAYIKSYYHFY